MGALHPGHISLVEQSVKENDFTVCSIFVNPTQFGEKTDLETYPRPIEKDIALLLDASTDLLFLPEPEQVYPPDYKQQVFDLQGLDLEIEGKQRPGHFQGVCNVIYRFFEIIRPDNAYFGQKDFQQTVVVKRLTDLMRVKTRIRVMPISREESGLAMSSRNTRLNASARREASFVYRFLQQAKEEALSKDLTSAMETMKSKIEDLENAVLEYLIAVDADSLQKVDDLNHQHPVVLLTVIRFHGVRLLDNIYI
jgi:pantoate--beta-alanine ligase